MTTPRLEDAGATLACLPKMTPTRMRALVEHFGSVLQAFTAVADGRAAEATLSPERGTSAACGPSALAREWQAAIRADVTANRIARRGTIVWVDGTEASIPAPENTSGLGFSYPPTFGSKLTVDDQGVAFFSNDGGSYKMENGALSPAAEILKSPARGTVEYSLPAGGSGVIHVVSDNGKYFIAVNDAVGERGYDQIYNVKISDDKRRFGFGARDGRDIWWVVQELH